MVPWDRVHGSRIFSRGEIARVTPIRMRRLGVLFSLFALFLPAACGDDPEGIRDVPVTAERTLPGLAEEAFVLRTELNVPHVYAKSMNDLALVQGFVMAQDRYVQIELTRRFGAGTLSELLGDLGLSIDQTSREQGMREIAQRIYDHASPELRARFDAFAAGVNLYIEDVKHKRAPLPEEVELVGSFVGLDEPRDAMKPITGFDVAAVAAVIVSRLGYETIDLDRDRIEGQLATAFVPSSTTAPPIALVELRKAGVKDDLVHAMKPVHTLTSVNPGVRSSALHNSMPSAVASPSSLSLVERGTLARAIDRSSAIMAWLGKTQRDEFGSNSWAVSAKGTGGHGALLSNDGHLPLTVPSLFYQMCLDSDYFGDSGYSVCGLFFPGLPMLAVGTNGHVAWGQTYLDADLNDWYREEVRLGGDGLPEATMFQGDWKPVQRVDETYGVPSTDTPGTLDMVTKPRFATFDGRKIISIEGDDMPRDVNGDGKVEAISLDWTAFDVTNTVDAVDGFAHANSVAEFIEVTRKLIGYGQNIIVADTGGAIAYSAYHGLPCRDRLPKQDGDWIAGANPMRILDGTQYGGFEIPSGENGVVLEGGSDCVVPFEVGPRAITPDAGYVLTANHDPLGYGLDGSLSNDPYYIGGPWDLGYRANTIDTHLADLTSRGAANADEMSKLQGNHSSPLGLEYAPVLLASIDHAATIAARGPMNEAETREAAIYAQLGARADQVKTRLAAWLARGAVSASGVETFYDHPTDDDRQDAVATMIHAAWLRAFVTAAFADENIDFAFMPSRAEKTFRVLHQLVAGRGADNPLHLSSFNAATGESAFFDVLGTDAVETSHEVILSALVTALDRLAGADGFGSDDMDQWLWGLEHHVRFKALLEEVAPGNPLAGILAFKFAINTQTLPLAADLPASDPRSKLENFPRPGDFFTVDVGAGGFDGPYEYSQGPVMRMVIALDGESITGRNILPGGQSGLAGDAHFADQAAMWLANTTIPIRYHAGDVVAGAAGNEKMSPPK